MKNKMMDVENVGIMQGFLNQVGEEEDELEEEEGSEESSSARILNRRPDSPEILMNNLRGDMRSIDARREELADLVGYDAAAETPETVLAMLQPVLAQQGGLGALPQSSDMAQGPQAPMPPPSGGDMGVPPPGAPPLPPGGPPPPAGGDMAALLAAAGPPPGGGMAPGGMMPGGPPPEGPMIGPDGQPIPPEGMPPIQMYRGGEVQRFSNGSLDPDGEEDDETQKDDSTDYGTSSYSADQVEDARRRLMSLVSQRQLPEPDIKKLALEREKLYTDVLGEDKNMQQAQLLFALAQKGLQFAGNVDARGQPLRGSPASRFAAVASELPGEINKFISDSDKRGNTIRLAALEAAERDATNIRSQNVRLIDAQRRAYGSLARQGTGEKYPASKWFMDMIYRPGNLNAWADGELSSDLDTKMEQAVNSLIADSTERITYEPYKDSMNVDQVRQVKIPGYKLPRAVQEAIARRQVLLSSGWRPMDASPTSGALIGDDATSLPSDEAALEGGAASVGAAPVGAAPGAGTTLPAPQKIRTLWEDAHFLSDVDVGLGFIAQNVPPLSDMSSEAQIAQRNFTQQINNLVTALSNSPRFAEAERQDIKEELGLGLSVFTGAAALRNNFMGLYRVLRQDLQDAQRDARNPELSGDFRKQRQMSAVTIDDFLKIMMPPPIYTIDDYKKLPVGSSFLRREKEQWKMGVKKSSGK
jgi:hypothetical protein